MIDKGKWQPKKNLSQQELEEGRNNLIADLTLQGKFWGSRGALWLEKEFLRMWEFSIPRFEAPVGKYRTRNYRILLKMPAELFSAISSTYYAAGGNAGSRAEVSSLFSKVFWYWRGWRCLRVAEKLSDKFARLKPMEDMTLGELDTRACVLNKSGRKKEALVHLNYGIMKTPTQQTDLNNNLCLFLIHRGEVLTEMNNINEALQDYTKAVFYCDINGAEIKTKVRVLKSYGKFLIVSGGDFGTAKVVLKEALYLAEKNNLLDQVVKIKALLASVK